MGSEVRDKTNYTPIRWQCIQCRTMWEQPAFVHISFACTKCQPPYYSGELVWEVTTQPTPAFTDPCRCVDTCCDSDPDGPGVCKGLPRAPKQPLVEIVLEPRWRGPDCTCLEYGHGLNLTRVVSRSCPAHPSTESTT